MLDAAELTDNVDDRFADLEVGLYAVMLERDDVRVLLCNDMREALECARRVRHENRELELTAAGDEALLDDLVDEGNVDVAAGEDADDLFALDVDLVVEHGRERSGAGGLNDLLAALEQQQDGGGDLVVGDRDNAVYVLLDIFEGLFARSLYRDAVCDGVNGIRRLALARAEGVRDRRSTLGLYADDLDARVDLLGAGSDTGDQSAAAGRNEDHVDKRQVAQDLERDGALTGHDVLIVERMDELRAGLPGLGIGFVINVARQNDISAVALGRGDLGDRRGARHDDGGLDADRACREGNALCVVACGGCDDCVQVALGIALHDLVVRAAHLERAGFLLVFVLQIDLGAGHGGEGCRSRQRDVVDYVFQTVGCRLEIFQF